MDETNDNQHKFKPLGSKLEQRALLTVLCQTFKPMQETVLKGATLKIEALGTIKEASLYKTRGPDNFIPQARI